jgi:hypothetical protein
VKPTDITAEGETRLLFATTYPQKGGNSMNKLTDIIPFLIRAKKQTYAAKGGQVASSRPCSHDLRYEEGEMLYIDTYLGGERFAGEEAVWRKNVPLWAMNYVGRVTGENFSGDFLKEALLNVPEDMPYRGPASYASGDYLYKCNVSGDFSFFSGYEEIFFRGESIYECHFHGGEIFASDM